MRDIKAAKTQGVRNRERWILNESEREIDGEAINCIYERLNK